MGRWSQLQCWHGHLWLAKQIQWVPPSCQACGTGTDGSWPCRWAMNHNPCKRQKRNSHCVTLSQRKEKWDESVTAAAVSSLVDGNNLSWSWPLETARCHRPRTLSGLLFWSSPRSTSIGRTAHQMQVNTQQLYTQREVRKLDLVKWTHISVTSESNTVQQNEWNI